MEKGRIETDPKVLFGKPVIRGTRIPVYAILDLMAAGLNIEQVLEQYPRLKKEDVVAAVEFASGIVKKEEVELA